MSNKAVQAKFADDDQEAIRRLTSGIDNLRNAVKNLLLTPEEQELIQRLIFKQTERRAFFQARLGEKNKAAKKAFTKIQRAEQERIQDNHKKSGYSDFLIRAPGSYGSGSK